ncbi:MAG: hypothetical protein ABIN67_14155 [Ferruginibacter sp.]
MTKTLTVFISVCFFISSCNNPKATEDNADQNNSKNDKADIAKLNDALKKYEEPSQLIKVSADKPSVVTGRKGTKISINPNDLVTESGKPLGQNIEVELKELTNQRQLLRTNAQTVSDGKLLVSGGAYFIGMTSNGEQLKLKEGKTLSVQFPKLSDKEMALFYGQRNDLEQINWQKATETFKTTQPPANTQPATDAIKTKRKSDIEAIMDYVDSGYNPTPEEKERNIQQRKNYIVSQKVYDEIGIAKLGWINCDRFLEVEDKTDLYASFNPQDSIKNANVYLVFKDINSVIQAYYYSDKSPQFGNMPVGYKARLIAYTVKDEKVFAYSTDLTITKGQNLTLNLKEISDKDFKKLISN